MAEDTTSMQTGFAAIPTGEKFLGTKTNFLAGEGEAPISMPPVLARIPRLAQVAVPTSQPAANALASAAPNLAPHLVPRPHFSVSDSNISVAVVQEKPKIVSPENSNSAFENVQYSVEKGHRVSRRQEAEFVHEFKKPDYAKEHEYRQGDLATLVCMIQEMIQPHTKLIALMTMLTVAALSMWVLTPQFSGVQPTNKPTQPAADQMPVVSEAIQTTPQSQAPRMATVRTNKVAVHSHGEFPPVRSIERQSLEHNDSPVSRASAPRISAPLVVVKPVETIKQPYPRTPYGSARYVPSGSMTEPRESNPVGLDPMSRVPAMARLKGSIGPVR